MKNSKLYKNYLTKWQEIVELPTQNVGIFTPFYKRAIPYFKVAPWRFLIPVSFILAVLLAIIMEVSILQIASSLQKGF